MKAKYFYKIENNIEFVWRIRQIEDDPYRIGQSIAEHFVGNTKQFVKWIVRNEKDLKERNLLTGYREIYENGNNEDGVIYDEVLGLLRKDKKFPTIFAYRQIEGLKKIALIEFDEKVKVETTRNLFQKAVNIDLVNGMKIIEAGFEHYKKLWSIDEYFSEPNLNTIEKFLPTIELQSIWLDENPENEVVTYSFRPSWDEEHGLRVRFDFKAMTCEAED